MKHVACLLVVVLCGFLAVGCSHVPLSMECASGIDQSRLARYQILVVDEFQAGEKAKDDDLIRGLDEKVVFYVKQNYPGLFEDVVESGSAAAEYPDKDVMKVGGVVKTLAKGSRFARAVCIGLGSSKLEVDIALQDYKTGEKLASGKVKRYYALGGAAGASYGIEDMVKGTAIEVADKIYELKTGQKK